MPRSHKIWFWKARKTRCVKINKVRHVLGPDKEAAETEFHEITLKQKQQAPVSGTVAEVCDLFLQWAEKHGPASFEWYKKHIKPFAETLPDKLMRVRDLKAHHIDTFVDKDTWGDSYRRGAITAIARAAGAPEPPRTAFIVDQ